MQRLAQWWSLENAQRHIVALADEIRQATDLGILFLV